MALPHARLRIGGSLYTSDHHWSIGINFVPENGLVAGNAADEQTALENWRDKVRALNGGSIFPAGVRGIISSACTIEYVRTSYVGADGKERAVAQVDLATAVRGTGNPVHPTQVALVVSLLTGRPGASYRGRVYLPCLASTATGNGTIQTADTQDVATGFSSFLSDAGAAGSIPQNALRAAVVSGTKGTSLPVTNVRVGNRFDIQRRRAEGQKESYSGALVTQ